MRKAVYFLFLFVFACSSHDKWADKTVFRYNEPGGITSLDPAYSRNLENIWAVNQLFDGLLELDENLDIQPCIAKNWDISGDGKTYTFYLRNDVLFHECEELKSKRKVTASDFVYSFNRILNPKTASPGKWVFNEVDSTQPFQALNDTTLVIRLKKPFPAFLSILTMTYCNVVPQEVIENRDDQFGQNPIGSGPFQFFIWKERIKMVFHKNENYFQHDENRIQLPYLDAISISFLKDANAAFLGMLKGDFDFISGLDGAYKDELLTPEGEIRHKLKEKFKLVKSPFLFTEYIGILQDSAHPFFIDVEFRKALSRGIDRKKLIKYVRNGVGIPAHSGFIPESLIENRKTGGIYNYNPEQAKKTIRELEKRLGQKVPIIQIAATSPVADLMEFVQKSWEDLGLTVEIDFMPSAVHREKVATAQCQFFRKSWVADYPDAQNFASMFYTANIPPSGSNYTHFSIPEFDRLYEASLAGASLSERDSLYNLMDSFINQHCTAIPLFYGEIIQLQSKQVNGLHTNAMNVLDLKSVQVSAQKPR